MKSYRNNSLELASERVIVRRARCASTRFELRSSRGRAAGPDSKYLRWTLRPRVVSVKLVSAGPVSEAVLMGRVFLSRAFKTDSSAELSRVLRQVAGARQQVGRPLLCLIVVDPEAVLPSEAGRLAIQRATLSLLNYCESLTLIVEGNELQQSLLRTALRGMATIAGKSVRLRVVEHLQAAARIVDDPGLVLPELERLGREAGVWSSRASQATGS